MNRLEIIHLRSSEKAIESLCERITESIRGEGKDAEVVTLYRRRGLDTDVAIHLHHRRSEGETGPSPLALHFANALKSFGLVEHTLWHEMGPNNED